MQQRTARDLDVGPEDVPKPPSYYARRADNEDYEWLSDAIEDYLGLKVTPAQKKICRAVAEHERVLVSTANGLGKSYILAAITVVWLMCRYPAVSFATSGTEKKMKRTYCKPVESLHDSARIPLPGRYKQQPPRIEVDGDPEHFFEAASPKDAGELEGVHTAYTLAIIEEADKEDVDDDVIDAMKSLVSDEQDRIVAIANPPKDETNSIYPILDEKDDPDSKWKVIELSSFEAHNVQVEIDHPTPYDADGTLKPEVRTQFIDGIATLKKIRDDWEDYNGTEWPGVEVARNAHREDSDHYREGLDDRWLRRRVGVMPGADASVHRPFTISDVNEAFERPPKTRTREPQGLGLDVARKGGDTNGLGGVFGHYLEVIDRWARLDHNENEARVRKQLGNEWDVTFAVDATPEGSGLADRISTFYPGLHRFNNGSNAADELAYKDCWTEGLVLLGKFLRNGGSFTDSDLREQLLAAARTIELEEKYYSSRDDDVYKATSKEEVKQALDNQSPDLLDMAVMAVWARDAVEPSSEDDFFIGYRS